MQRLFARGLKTLPSGRKSHTLLWSSLAALSAGTIGYTIAQRQRDSSPPEHIFPLSSTTKLRDLPSPTYCTQTQSDAAKKDIIALGVEHSTSLNDINQHSYNEYTLHPPSEDQKPWLITYPTSTEQVSEIVKICHAKNVPMLPFAGGTSIEGQYISTRNGTVVIDVSRMDKVLSFNKEDLDITVQGGVGWQDINAYVESHNLMMGIDPAPGALIAGCVGTSCSGTNAFRYGTMKENVINLTVVLPDGTIFKTKKRPRKSSNGYNLTGLFIGSEGTLGIVTEATLKLHVKSRFETVSVVSFPTLVDATNTVKDIILAGIQVNAVELLDANMMKAINFSGQTSKKWVEGPTLLFKIGSNNTTVLNEFLKEIENISKTNNSLKFESAKNKEQQDELWSARKAIFWSSIDYGRSMFGPNVKVWSTDVAVPLSNLSKCIEETVEEITNSGLYGTIVGHVGDGNFHTLIMYNEETEKKAMALVDSMVVRGLKYDGTCSGEHGIGTSKRNLLEQELTPLTIDVMRKLKLSLDPKRLMNPDKIFKIDPADNLDDHEEHHDAH